MARSIGVASGIVAVMALVVGPAISGFRWMASQGKQSSPAVVDQLPLYRARQSRWQALHWRRISPNKLMIPPFFQRVSNWLLPFAFVLSAHAGTDAKDALIIPARTSAVIKGDSATTSDVGRWSFEFGMARLTENTLGDILSGHISVDDSDSGGEIYQVTATKAWKAFDLNLADHEFHPLLETPFCLEMVEENSRFPFFDLNAAVQGRWVDFPWNPCLRTSFAIGLGLSYSSKLYLNDIKYHPNEDRSYLKFDLPIQFTFALPSHPNEELVCYLAHHSGGFGIFDKGGVNSVGIGLRFKL